MTRTVRYRGEFLEVRIGINGLHFLEEHSRKAHGAAAKRGFTKIVKTITNDTTTGKSRTWTFAK